MDKIRLSMFFSRFRSECVDEVGKTWLAWRAMRQPRHKSRGKNGTIVHYTKIIQTFVADIATDMYSRSQCQGEVTRVDVSFPDSIDMLDKDEAGESLSRIAYRALLRKILNGTLRPNEVIQEANWRSISAFPALRSGKRSASWKAKASLFATAGPFWSRS